MTAAQDWVLHIDLDQFLVAVEVRRRPELAGQPVIVGGDGNPSRPRQVVATSSYEARAFGVTSGMPLRTAWRRCPDAIFLAHDRPVYEAASAEVMAALRTLPVVVEVWGWDEAFLGVHTVDPEDVAHAVRARVLDATGLSSAVGIGETRLQAKTATASAKPGGVSRLPGGTWMATMAERPVDEIWGIGARTAARLDSLGIHTVAELAASDHRRLAEHFGPTIGPNLKLMGLGGHRSPIVDEPHVARSRSQETTFERDLADPAAIAEQVQRLALAVGTSVVAEGRVVTHVSVKVRTRSFATSTRIAKLPEPTTDPAEMARMAAVVLGRFELDRPVRLLGVRVVLQL